MEVVGKEVVIPTIVHHVATALQEVQRLNAQTTISPTHQHAALHAAMMVTQPSHVLVVACVSPLACTGLTGNTAAVPQHLH